MSHFLPPELVATAHSALADEVQQVFAEHGLKPGQNERGMLVFHREDAQSSLYAAISHPDESGNHEIWLMGTVEGERLNRAHIANSREATTEDYAALLTQFDEQLRSEQRRRGLETPDEPKAVAPVLLLEKHARTQADLDAVEKAVGVDLPPETAATISATHADNKPNDALGRQGFVRLHENDPSADAYVRYFADHHTQTAVFRDGKTVLKLLSPEGTVLDAQTFKTVAKSDIAVEAEIVRRQRELDRDYVKPPAEAEPGTVDDALRNHLGKNGFQHVDADMPGHDVYLRELTSGHRQLLAVPQDINEPILAETVDAEGTVARDAKKNTLSAKVAVEKQPGQTDEQYTADKLGQAVEALDAQKDALAELGKDVSPVAERSIQFGQEEPHKRLLDLQNFAQRSRDKVVNYFTSREGDESLTGAFMRGFRAGQSVNQAVSAPVKLAASAVAKATGRPFAHQDVASDSLRKDHPNLRLVAPKDSVKLGAPQQRDTAKLEGVLVAETKHALVIKLDHADNVAVFLPKKLLEGAVASLEANAHVSVAWNLKTQRGHLLDNQNEKVREMPREQAKDQGRAA